MNARQYAALFISSLASWFVGINVMPLLPIYAAELGATPAMIGNFLAFSFLMLSLGTAMAGWLAARLQHRRALIIAAAALCLPATWLMGRAGSVWQLAVLTATVWFGAGIVVTLQSILAGMFATAQTRGRVFGMLATTISLAGLIGGPFVGALADRLGFRDLFALLALCWVVALVSACFLPDRRMPPAATRSTGSQRANSINRPFWLLVGANFIISVGLTAEMMGGPLAMSSAGLPLAALTLVTAIRAGAGLLFNPLFGYLSDRIGRRGLLYLAFGVTALGLVLLARAQTTAAFWLTALLFTITNTKEAGMQALTTDLAGGEQLDRRLALLATSRWAGSVLGFILVGVAIQITGLQRTIGLAALLPLAALLILLRLPAQSAPMQQTADLRTVATSDNAAG